MMPPGSFLALLAFTVAYAGGMSVALLLSEGYEWQGFVVMMLTAAVSAVIAERLTR